MKTLNAPIILAFALSLTACMQGSDSDVASLEGAQNAKSGNSTYNQRALELGKSPDEAIDQVYNYGVPYGLLPFLGYDHKTVVNPENPKLSKAAIREKCQDLAKDVLKRTYPEMAEAKLADVLRNYRDMDSCWENIGEGDDSHIVVHLVADSVNDVHQNLPEALFLAFFEGKAELLADTAKDVDSTVDELTEGATDADVKDSVALVKQVVAVRDEFALKALHELNALDTQTLARYQKTFGGAADAASLAQNPIVRNFLLAELMAAYYGSYEESEALQQALPETYQVARKMGKYFGKAYWQYNPDAK